MLFRIRPVTKPNLKPMKMQSSGAGPSPGKVVKVIGTGAVNRKGSAFQARPKQATLKIVSHAACNSRYGGGIVQNSMVCATSQTHDACVGDSGGPLYIPGKKPVLVGLVTFGWSVCGDGKHPGGYAKISGGINWIRSAACKLSERKPYFCGRRRRAGKRGSGKKRVRSAVPKGESQAIKSHLRGNRA